MNVELLLNAPLGLLITGGVLGILSVAFLLLFFIPGIQLRLYLDKALRQLRTTKPLTSGDLSGDLQKIFEDDSRLLHLWKEFKDTLHPQKEERDGQMVTVALRATTTAEAFFNTQYVVDGRLHTEFFKHLPGIFTGIGIIGTFAGLIGGLQKFNVPDDPVKVRASLEILLHGVFEAFLVSAAAITLAMVVTFFEKALLASLYRYTDDIAQHLDSIFTSGAGEEYLSRLVTASEDSASQSKILKDSLVGDLKALLQEISEKQIAAHATTSQTLAQQITTGIQQSLQDPLNKIGDIVAKASGDQSSATASLLKDVMSSFSQRLNDLFGGQISGIQELNQKSAQAMQEAVASLNALVGRMADNSQRSEDAMAEKMVKAVEEMERRQADINTQTQRFVESIREMISNSQSETNTKLNDAITGLSTQMGEMISALQSQAEKSHREQAEREQIFNDRTKGMVTDLGDSVADVVKQMAASTAQMQQSVASLERTTASSIDKLNSGARTIEQGATAFAQAGDKVTAAMIQASTVAGKLTEVGGALTASSSALQGVLSDYRTNREATGAMLTELKSVVESAKREASLTQQALDRIQTAATKLAAAQQETEAYLEGVSKILAEAHGEFADGLTRTLDRANSDFHSKLSVAVGLLSSAIEELEVTVSSAGAPRR